MPPSNLSENQSPPSCLLVVDGHAYAYRAFHAIPRLTAPDGAPTNAILGFIKMLGKLITQYQPNYAVVVWDGGLAAERLVSLPEYKAQRPPMPRELEQQLTEIEAYLQAANIASVCLDGLEADDLIASIIRKFSSLVGQTLIASSDKDFMQLVSERIGLLNPSDKSAIVWSAEQVQAKTGVEPHQIVDWLSLIGDTVDNIPGVPGIGPKTASKLLCRFGSCAVIYNQLEQIESDSLRMALCASASIVERNQKLIRLKDDLPCPLTLDSLTIKQANEDRLGGLYTRWGFHSLSRELESRKLRQTEMF